MPESIKISVVVPAYNNAPWLPRCLDSLLAQTYQNIEIIVVDDGSTDNTLEVLSRYQAADSRIFPIHQKNSGVTSARLHGIRQASGDWIGFVDGDDAVEPDMYQRLLSNALTYHADISHCGYQMVFDDGRINYFHNTGALLEHGRDEACRELLSGIRIEPGLWNKLFRADLFKWLEGNMDFSVKINEDLLMNFILFSHAEKAVFDDFCPYHYIVRRGSASRQALNPHKIYDPILVKESILRMAPATLTESAAAAYLSTCINIYNSLATSDQLGLQEDQANIRNKILRHRQWMNLLSKKQYLLAQLIRFIPWIYGTIYGFYKNHFLKDPYN